MWSIRYLFFFCFLGLLFSANCTLPNDTIYITSSDKYHIVRKGDTLTGISRQHNIPIARLKLYNNLEGDRIFAGQKLYLYPRETELTTYVTRRDIPLSGEHIVSPGETVYRISKMYGLEIIDLMEYNSLETFDIQAGQRLLLTPSPETVVRQTPTVSRQPEETPESPTIEPAAPVTPPATPVKDATREMAYHIVRQGETLWSISRQYGMTVQQLSEMNGLNSTAIHVGQSLAIRGHGSGSTPKVRPPEKKPVIAEDSGLYCPLKGRVTSEFGLRDGKPHKGIDISAPLGEPIYAALAGKVVYSGLQKGYGNLIIIEHPGAVMTVYAHNDANLVRQGDHVSKGQPIATVGNTGNSTGPHLHFEYRKQGRAINPRKVLPDL